MGRGGVERWGGMGLRGGRVGLRGGEVGWGVHDPPPSGS